MRGWLGSWFWLCLLCLTVSGQETHFKVAVVLKVVGNVERQPEGRPVSQPVRALQSLREKDTLLLDPGESLQILWLSDHSRYDLKGPLREVLGGRKTPPPSSFRLSQLQPQRQALRAGTSIDLHKYGGGSARDLGLAWQMFDESRVVLVLPPEPLSSLECREGERRLNLDPITLNLDLELQPGESRDLCLSWRGGQRNIRVSRLNPEDAARLKTLRRAPETPQDWQERIVLSLRLRMAYRAHRDFQDLRRQFPQAAKELGPTFDDLLRESGAEF